jgi:proline iminopeptidase
MDGAYWKPWASPLAEDCQVIYLDQRGAGRSDAGPEERWTFEQWGDDVRAVCDALEIERPLVCGSSFGGEVAMAYATRHPDHPAKLIILSAAPRLNVDRIAAVFERLGGPAAAGAARAFWRGMTPETGAAYARHCLPQYFRAPQDPDHDARSVLNSELTEWYLREGGPAHTCDFLPALASVQCPTLVMGARMTRSRPSRTWPTSRPLSPRISYASSASRTAATARSSTRPTARCRSSRSSSQHESRGQRRPHLLRRRGRETRP